VDPTTSRRSAGEYNRAGWPHWVDADGDCQDTRSEILIRDNTGTIKFKRNKPCNVSWGRWVCPYTGKVLIKASDVDIDHVVPLAHAHATGGASWTRAQRRAFANDPDNLLAIDDATNQEKSDQGPDEWRPPRREYWPEYAKKWQAVKTKYGLTISASEERALQEMGAEKIVHGKFLLESPLKPSRSPGSAGEALQEPGHPPASTGEHTAHRRHSQCALM
jgi:hypothetical protein